MKNINLLAKFLTASHFLASDLKDVLEEYTLEKGVKEDFYEHYKNSKLDIPINVAIRALLVTESRKVIEKTHNDLKKAMYKKGYLLQKDGRIRRLHWFDRVSSIFTR